VETVDISCGWVVGESLLPYTRVVSFLVAFVLGTSLLLLLGEAIISKKRFSQTITAFLFAGALGLFWVGYAPALRGLAQGTPVDIDPWHVFHYDLNARYFDELGYTNLYSCALKADEMSAHSLDHVQEVRDLQTYALVPRASLVPCPQERFSPERWSAFQADLITIHKTLPVPTNESYASWQGDKDAYWRAIFQDKGYNLSPFAARITQKMFPIVSGAQPKQWNVIFMLELLFLLLAVCAVAWAFSLRAAALFSLGLVSFFGTYPFLVNMLFQHLWLPCVVFGLVAWKRGYRLMSLSFLTVAAFLRIFPVFFLVPLFLSFKKRSERVHALIVLGATSIIAMLVGGPIPLWQAYLLKIGEHRSFLSQEVFNIGWPTLAVQLVPSTKIFFWIGAILLTVGYLFATRRASGLQRSLLSVALIYALLALSPYYYLVIPLLALLQPIISKKFASLSASAILVVFMGHAFLGQFGLVYFSNTNGPHVWSEVSILGLILFHLWLVWRETKDIKENVLHTAS
jgi:hypothetical protein